MQNTQPPPPPEKNNLTSSVCLLSQTACFFLSSSVLYKCSLSVLSFALVVNVYVILRRLLFFSRGDRVAGRKKRGVESGVKSESEARQIKLFLWRKDNSNNCQLLSWLFFVILDLT